MLNGLEPIEGVSPVAKQLEMHPSRERQVVSRLWRRLKDADFNGSIAVQARPVVDGNKQIYLARCRPVNVIAWAESRNIKPPTDLITCVREADKAAPQKKIHGNTVRFSNVRERLLGAAVAVVVANPEEC